MRRELLVYTCNLGNGRAEPARLAKILTDLTPEIVGLQEVNQYQAEGLEKLLSAEYEYRALFPDGFAGKGILSRIPISDAALVDLGPERPDLKVVLDIDGKPLTVISAHPPPPRFHNKRFGFEAGTKQQINALASLTIGNDPAILVGDFNLVSSQPEYRMIMSTGLRDAFKESGKGTGFTLPRRIGPWRRFQRLNKLLSWIPLIPAARIDYIWFTAGLTCRSCWIGNDVGSDHLPVLATFDLL